LKVATKPKKSQLHDKSSDGFGNNEMAGPLLYSATTITQQQHNKINTRTQKHNIQQHNNTPTTAQ
jgi:hypothetical protein